MHSCITTTSTTGFARPSRRLSTPTGDSEYGKESRLSDNETSGTEGSEEETEDENGEENAESDEEQGA